MTNSDPVFEKVGAYVDGLRFFAVQFLKRTASDIDKTLIDAQFTPSTVIMASVFTTLALVALIYFLKITSSPASTRKNAASSSAKRRSFSSQKKTIQEEEEKLRVHLEQKKKAFRKGEKPITSLPTAGWSSQGVLNYLRDRYKRNVHVHETESKISGAIYMSGVELESLLSDVYQLHSLTSPLHPDVFPSVRQMEAEVVSMCGNLLNPHKVAKNVCGAMTSGGSESILSAIKASRDYMRDRKNITEPEMIIAQSAHPAYHKAAETFNIKLITLTPDENHQLPVKELRKSITPNTVVLVASAPGFPHGIIDPIKEISDIAQEYGVLLHVDCCLGGFFLPFARELGYEVPAFDFSLEGVTTISVDTHKYGMAHKGSSVVLYRSPELRRYQYTAVSTWTGGMYISPGFAGTRSGALIATAWACLVFTGREGYLKITEGVMNAVEDFVRQLESIPELEIVGQPIGSVLAIKLRKNPEKIHQINAILTEKGWHLTPLQFPPALHISFTARHVDVVDRLIEDIRMATEAVRDLPTPKVGTATIYGTACTVPDRSIVTELLQSYQDILLAP